MTKHLFSPEPPLAERLRPKDLKEFIGQRHILGPGCLLQKLLERKRLPSLILWGPPGCGKTTLAYLLARAVNSSLLPLSAVEAGVKEMREVVKKAQKRRALGQASVLFVDEIHRFNKAQQDFLLPFVERGEVILLGATTENPSFRIISPLLSRCKVLNLKPLSSAEILEILRRAVQDPRGLGGKVELEEGLLEILSQKAQGDARVALNFLEALYEMAPEEGGRRKLTLSLWDKAALEKPLLYDQSGEEHYNLLSAYHKSLRGSDPDAAIYWMVRMLEAGEDPLVIVRRLVTAAAEDVGNADPQALLIALAAKEAVEFLGLPEGEIPLAQATIYVACAPKSNACYRALGKAREDVRRHGALPVPLHLRNPETALMRALGYGKGYRYPHDYPQAFVDQEYLPSELRGRRYYHPVDRGYEKKLAQRLAELRKKRDD